MAFIQSQGKPKIFSSDLLLLGVKSLVMKFKRYRLYNKTVSELRGLTVRELSDLGLSRSIIKNVAYIAVYENRDGRKDIGSL